MNCVRFECQHVCARTGGRAGLLHTPHGSFETPLFMPVGTQATVKGVMPRDLLDLGAGIVLSNTYHLVLRPGAETVAALGGLHRMMDWPRGLLTDSGGFQVFSLQGRRKVTDEGVEFASHIDGSRHLFTAESVMAAQQAIGADIIMAFDECSEAGADYTRAARAMERTHAWAKRCVAAHEGHDTQALFAICQGGMYEDLRRESAQAIAALDTPGVAIGGLSVGEDADTMCAMLDVVRPHLPQDKPRYLMGVGTPDYLLHAVKRGVDMFDCVLPTRTARTGCALVGGERLNLRQARYARETGPVDEKCKCPACQRFSRGYIHHLVRQKEMLGATLLSLHNIAHLLDFCKTMRTAIFADKLDEVIPGVI